MSPIVTALTEMQVDRILDIVSSALKTVAGGIGVVWSALAPFLIGYLVIRQKVNRKALDDAISENTEVSKEAFRVANGHNAKIAELTNRIAIPRQVEVVNSPDHPVPVETEHK